MEIEKLGHYWGRFLWISGLTFFSLPFTAHLHAHISKPELLAQWMDFEPSPTYPHSCSSQQAPRARSLCHPCQFTDLRHSLGEGSPAGAEQQAKSKIIPTILLSGLLHEESQHTNQVSKQSTNITVPLLYCSTYEQWQRQNTWPCALFSCATEFKQHREMCLWYKYKLCLFCFVFKGVTLITS